MVGFLFSWRALDCAVLAEIFFVPMGWWVMMVLGRVDRFLVVRVFFRDVELLQSGGRWGV